MNNTNQMTAEEKRELLKNIGNQLPYGSIKRIADKFQFSNAYVSKFFSGKMNLTLGTLPLLDEAKHILDQMNEEQKILLTFKSNDNGNT